MREFVIIPYMCSVQHTLNKFIPSIIIIPSPLSFSCSVYYASLFKNMECLTNLCVIPYAIPHSGSIIILSVQYM